MRVISPRAARGVVLVLDDPAGPEPGGTDVVAAVEQAGFEVHRPHLSLENIEHEVRRIGADLVLVRFEYKGCRGGMVEKDLRAGLPHLPVVLHSDNRESVENRRAIEFQVQHRIHDTRKVREHVEGLEHLVRCYRAGARWRRLCEALRPSAAVSQSLKLAGPFDLTAYLKRLEAGIVVAMRREKCPGEAATTLGLLPRRLRRRSAAACGQTARELPLPRGAVTPPPPNGGPGRILIFDDNDEAVGIASAVVAAIQEAGHRAVRKREVDDPVRLVLDEGLDLVIINAAFCDPDWIVHGWSLARALPWLPLLLVSHEPEARTCEVIARLGLNDAAVYAKGLGERLRDGMVADGIGCGRAMRASEVWRREMLHEYRDPPPEALDITRCLLTVRTGIAVAALAQHEGNISAAARFLGLRRQTLQKWAKPFRIRRVESYRGSLDRAAPSCCRAGGASQFRDRPG